MTNTQPQERRRRLLVDSEQQRRVVMSGVLLAIILLNALLIVAVLFNPKLLAHIDLLDTLVWAGVECAVVGIIGYLSLVISHRIAGPAYALMRDLDRLAAGDLTVRTRLREGDFYVEMGDGLRTAAEHLSARIGAIKAAMDELAAASGADHRLRPRIDALLEELAYFKTGPAAPGAQEARQTEGDRPLDHDTAHDAC